MKSDKKIISIIIPVYNESKNIQKLIHSLDLIKKTEKTYEFEFLFINDGSIDDTSDILIQESKNKKYIRVIEFSRNFGKEAATTCGLVESKGDSVMIIDADLQHPPEKIPEFIRKWESGFDVVIGVREKNEGHSFLRKIGSIFYYKLMNIISENQSIQYSTDFRLLDRVVVEEFCKLNEKQRITRGLIDWLGFKQDYISYTASKRLYGKVQYSYLKLIRLAVYSFISNSLFPLKFAGYLGMFISFFSGTVGMFIFINKFILNDYFNLGVSHIFSLAILLLFLVGLILCCLGLVALYIANIHVEVQNRPLYVIKKKNNP